MLRLQSERDWRFEIQEMLLTIDLLETFMSGQSAKDFMIDFRLVSNACLQMEAIGDLAAAVPAHVRQAHSEIPWSFLRNLRSPSARSHYRRDPRLTWITLQNRIFPLARDLGEILDGSPA